MSSVIRQFGDVGEETMVLSFINIVFLFAQDSNDMDFSSLLLCSSFGNMKDRLECETVQN